MRKRSAPFILVGLWLTLDPDTWRQTVRTSFWKQGGWGYSFKECLQNGRGVTFQVEGTLSSTNRKSSKRKGGSMFGLEWVGESFQFGLRVGHGLEPSAGPALGALLPLTCLLSAWPASLRSRHAKHTGEGAAATPQRVLSDTCSPEAGAARLPLHAMEVVTWRKQCLMLVHVPCPCP